MSLHVVGWTVPDRREIVEEHRDGTVRIQPGDPRHCWIDERHEPHEHRYVYERPAEHGGVTTGSYYCDGADPWDAPITVVHGAAP